MTEKEAVNIAGIAQALRSGAGTAARALGSAAKAAPGVAASAAKNVASVPGGVGNFALNTARRGLNVAGAGVDKLTRNGIVPEFAPAVNKTLWNIAETARGAGTKSVGALQKGVERATGMAHTSRFNPLNVGVGAGILGAGAKALSGGGAPAAPAAPAAPSPAQQFGAQAAGGFGGMSQRAQQMWGALPTEAKWAIGAGVPLALLGGYMGRKGGLGGLGLGALGLGAAALGGASGGVFGDDARRFSGKMLYNLGSFFGGKNDHASQLGMLSKLSPGMGATVLMGRDPSLSSEDAMKQYEFLTKNRDMIQRMLPSLTGKSAGDLAKAARCWKGYEPVPGKAPYSEDSCRPVGSKKKKPSNKKEAASSLFHHEKKELEPVVNEQKPSTENTKHVKVVHHDAGEGVNLKPEAADMKPDTKPVSD